MLGEGAGGCDITQSGNFLTWRNIAILMYSVGEGVTSAMFKVSTAVFLRMHFVWDMTQTFREPPPGPKFRTVGTESWLTSEADSEVERHQ